MAQTASRSKAKNTAGGGTVQVLNPACTNKAVERIPLAPRTLGSLEGKTVYLVDIGWGGPDAAYDVFGIVAERFAERFPGITTRVVRKNGFFSADDPELWDEVKEKGDACIIGISC
jgi:hypothetical protein